jgi:amino acid transporter
MTRAERCPTCQSPAPGLAGPLLVVLTTVAPLAATIYVQGRHLPTWLFIWLVAGLFILFLILTIRAATTRRAVNTQNIKDRR